MHDKTLRHGDCYVVEFSFCLVFVFPFLEQVWFTFYGYKPGNLYLCYESLVCHGSGTSTLMVVINIQPFGCREVTSMHSSFLTIVYVSRIPGPVYAHFDQFRLTNFTVHYQRTCLEAGLEFYVNWPHKSLWHLRLENLWRNKPLNYYYALSINLETSSQRWVSHQIGHINHLYFLLFVALNYKLWQQKLSPDKTLKRISLPK